MTNLTRFHDYFRWLGGFLMLLLSFMSFYDNSESYSSRSFIYSHSYSTWLHSSLLVTGCIFINCLIEFSYRAKTEQEDRRSKSNLILLGSFISFDLIILLSANIEYKKVEELQHSFNIAKLFFIAVSIMSTHLLNHFPTDRSNYVKFSSTISLVMITTGQALLTFNISQLSSNILFAIASFSFGCSCSFLFLPLWMVISEPVYHTIELKTEFTRISFLMVYLFVNTILHFTVSGDEILVTPILQIMLSIFLLLLSTYYYRKMLEEKEQKLQERMDLMRYISHEMRTPLNSAAIGLAMGLAVAVDLQVALTNALEVYSPTESHITEENAITKDHVSVASDQISTLMQVQDACSVAVATLDDILTFDKLSEGKLTAEFKDLDPWKFLNHTAQPFHFNASEKEIDLQILRIEEQTIELDNIVIKGDHFKLGQVVRNLISNALKFTPAKSKVEVTLQLLPSYILHPVDEELEQNNEKEPVDYQYVARISVNDSGIGIS